MGALDGKSVILTGAGSGIGRAVVVRFVAEGARVVAVDRDAGNLAHLRDELGDAVVPFAADVRSWDDNARAVRTAVSAFGGVDVYVANAGIFDGGRALADIPGEDLTAAAQEIFAVNVVAPMLGVRAAADELVKARGAVIITGSYASFHASGGGPLYTASKHAVLGLVRQLAYELAPDVRVNGVAPGVAPTRLGGIDALGQRPAESVMDGTREALPLQEIPSTAAYGGVYTLLANAADSGHITGTMLTADSGLAIRGLARPGGRVR
ncbi:3-phenylpropionate-dihydrodiol/cinnamic acid-dihydrodiol dehydrogenase [Sphaerisporangium krabiense]|uniref:NAD(P)-dependent dehydrogenase (Short-subunit alcohol dehydrogenase family) n=1 Tax=Sphaerisporangium krabiense TaxID=763782 RepID=A0A7W8Z951_9ACTN|nr:SDR family NAD(P)-dependent oxidoreductase [Sphaerisporangium krabiense]MBB5629640.1 NAD(P)-dependent dehydrogenase (short-subunit alcohol dehydrogenase family) [Sphaerisporangium krabiense]GII63738.1 3-phenylpropionate-dihydrodiol/cinnamic acid-dihydrodiol dehydrogenase [Sphaerisporangium krabiense]